MFKKLELPTISEWDIVGSEMYYNFALIESSGILRGIEYSMNIPDKKFIWV